MTDLNSSDNNFSKTETPANLPSFLNTLTVLTLVGSGFTALLGLYNYFTICDSVEKMEDLDLDGLAGGSMASVLDSAKEMLVKQCENNLALTVAMFVSAALCAWGAWQMRNLKKQGFAIYTLGEFLHPVVSIILLGSGAMGGLMMLSGLIIPVVFVILYLTQVKHMNA